MRASTSAEIDIDAAETLLNCWTRSTSSMTCSRCIRMRIFRRNCWKPSASRWSEGSESGEGNDSDTRHRSGLADNGFRIDRRLRRPYPARSRPAISARPAITAPGSSESSPTFPRSSRDCGPARSRSSESLSARTPIALSSSARRALLRSARRSSRTCRFSNTLHGKSRKLCCWQRRSRQGAGTDHGEDATVAADRAAGGCRGRARRRALSFARKNESDSYS